MVEYPFKDYKGTKNIVCTDKSLIINTIVFKKDLFILRSR